MFIFIGDASVINEYKNVKVTTPYNYLVSKIVLS
jgi:hypothetical protein